jgi:hypothetical protein
MLQYQTFLTETERYGLYRGTAMYATWKNRDDSVQRRKRSEDNLHGYHIGKTEWWDSWRHLANVFHDRRKLPRTWSRTFGNTAKISAGKLLIRSTKCHRYISLLHPMTVQLSLTYFQYWKCLKNRALKTEASIGVDRQTGTWMGYIVSWTMKKQSNVSSDQEQCPLRETGASRRRCIFLETYCER